MIVKYLELTSHRGNISSKVKDITNYISTVAWSGSKDEVARKLELSIINAHNDPNIKDLTLKLGSMVYLYSDDKKELFRGYITDRERSSNNTVSYTVYDLLFYTLKSKATYKFKSKTPESITKLVCDDIQIPLGSAAYTGKNYTLLMKDKSIYEIIMASYSKDKKVTKNNYHMITKQGKLYVTKMGDEWVNMTVSDDTNILSSSTKESLSDVVNQVKIYDDNNKVIKVVKNEDSITKYGVFQRTYTKEKGKDPTNSAKALFHGINKTMEIECLGNVECITGKCLKVTDSTSGLIGKFYISADSHSWQGGKYTMRLTLSVTNTMTIVDSDTENTSSSSKKSSNKSSTQKTISFNANGGKGTVSSITTNGGASITLPSGSGLSKAGSDFKGWAKTKTAKSAKYKAGDKFSVKSSTTLYAVWG